ncbi:MAG: sulfatase-like hydrolase/transferase [Verrucomicrobia bacterium]|nr:sulfatase-like hydrolase/transferase [Verrucomicrobiota bacterium]
MKPDFKRLSHLAVCVLLAATLTASAAPKPNVVVILADDSGWGDYSFNGNTNLRTPQIDSLARAGAMFDRFYVCPVCSPTRAEFLTGRYHLRGGVYNVTTGGERLNLNEKTIGDTFKAAGYATGAFGKWHNGSQWPYHPNARGFDEYYGFTSGHWGEYFDPPLEHNGKFVRGKGYITDDLTNHAMTFIEKNKVRPFFCYLPLNTPHSPFCVPDEYWNRFKDKPVTMRGKDGADEDLPVTRCALAMVENIDWNVGRLLRRLDTLKLADNTIVIYFSDNGPNSWRWNGGMKGRKGNTDEGGVRSPFLIRWPGKIKPGTTVQQIAGAIDLLPTLASMADVLRVGDRPLDGKDLSPLLFGDATAVRDWSDRTIFSHWGGNVSARSQRYRLDNTGTLFDMVTDPGQQTDIAQQQPEVAVKMRQVVADWRKEVGAKVLPAKGKGKGKAKTAAQQMDDRPFTVGYAEFPMTPLPARDGVPHGDVKRSAGAPNCSYFVNWTSPNDSMTWDIEVHTAGNYEVAIHYTCPSADAGSTIELSSKDSKVTGKVAPAWDPPLITDQDRVPRKGESYLKEFRRLNLGKMRLEQGRGLLTLRALKVAGKTVMDVRMVQLTLIK